MRSVSRSTRTLIFRFLLFFRADVEPFRGVVSGSSVFLEGRCTQDKLTHALMSTRARNGLARPRVASAASSRWDIADAADAVAAAAHAIAAPRRWPDV